MFLRQTSGPFSAKNISTMRHLASSPTAARCCSKYLQIKLYVYGIGRRLNALLTPLSRKYIATYSTPFSVRLNDHSREWYNLRPATQNVLLSIYNGRTRRRPHQATRRTLHRGTRKCSRFSPLSSKFCKFEYLRKNITTGSFIPVTPGTKI